MGAASISAAPDTAWRASGEVAAGGRFERRLPSGLRFVLSPMGSADRRGDSEGWDIRVLGADSLLDFAGLATPPYHGPNALGIMAWHFRNADNTGPNRGEVNAPTDVREFEFFLTDADARTAQAALDLVLWPQGRSEAASDSARAVLEALPRGTGRLLIRRIDLSPPQRGATPMARRMRFEVELHAGVRSVGR